MSEHAVPTADQIRTYLLANGWEVGEFGRAAYLMVTKGHTVRMLHEPTEYDRDKAVFDIALAEGRHPADVHQDILNLRVPAITEEADLGKQMRHRALGAYRLFWKSGGSSVAVVGQLYSGARWYACANWTSPDAERVGLVGTDWSLIERVEEIPDGGDDDA
ncbi:hypothetical protein Caci_3010 [Catenulispora acidiphila DSM 44928]|uniref:Uncharacterized protein n=1 Tax=Catenulispora acidiphila (strain DSM 44928 / JCM 14897 / NBRC 102108 / NRRL B-24433 / ID139908) TaxID=479433 RepID=C7Q4F0_CATAD|nr:hypothetical protein [Catenulispora acidiphila]ACU71919.1 hypothetical protein Caci_3010 [Catenulispora acidiphila DSM 44928]